MLNSSQVFAYSAYHTKGLLYMAKKKSNKQRKQIKRQTRHFQLRVEHPQDRHVAEILDYARTQRREVTLIREAVTLYWALENGNLEALFEKFPVFKANFASPTTTSTVDGGGQLDEIKSMLEMIAAQQQSNNGYFLQSTPGPKQLPAPSFAMPVFEEDDEPTVLIRASTSNDSALNFVTALRNMQ